MKDKRLKSDKLRFKKISKFMDKGSILDIGSTEGNLHKFILEKFNNKNVFSLDIKNNADFSMDLDHPKNISKKFDMIIAGEIIEHVESPINFLRYCKLLLKKNGKLILTTPNAIGLQYILNPSWCVDYEDYRGHSQAYTLPMLVKNFSELGFKVIHSEYINAFWISNPLEYFSLIFKKFRPDLMVVAVKK